MGDTDYKGEPIDASWQTAPWNRDGETIEASDDNAHEGNMETIDWPENATPKEELNDDQIAVIKTAAKYPNINSSKKLTQMAIGSKRSRQYASNTLVRHWQERYWAGKNDSRHPNGGEKGRDNASTTLTEEDVKEIRVRAKNGETSGEIADSFPVVKSTIRDAITGETWGEIEEYPPLKYDGKIGRYVEKRSHTENTLFRKGEDNGNSKLTERDVKEIRERVLETNNCSHILDDYDVSDATIYKAVNGDNWSDVTSPPPLVYNAESNSYELKNGYESDLKSDSDGSKHTDEKNSSNNVSTPTRKPTDTELDKRKALGVVAVAYVIYRLIRRLL